MSILQTCPQCGLAYTLADTQKGKTIRCKECQATFKVADKEDERPRRRKSVPTPPAEEEGNDTPAVADGPASQMGEEIPFSGKGLVKSLVWLIAWQTVCVAFALGMPILGYLAITRQGVNLEAIIPLVVCVLATLVGIWGLLASLASLRFFLLSTVPFSSHYLLTADRLIRYSRGGKVLEEIPFGNIAEIRLLTRRLTEVMGEGADSDVKARIVHINLRNPEHEKTVVDYHFMRWSQKVHDCDLALSEDFMGLPIKTVYKKIKKRLQQWQEGAGREEDGEQYRAPKRRRAPWYQRPTVIASGLLGVVALVGLVCVLPVALYFREPRAAQVPNPQPIAEGPNPKEQHPVVEGPIAKEQQPDKASPEKLNPRAIPGLIAYWPLNEGQGTITLDEHRKQPAAIQGGEWIQGIRGSAVRLNGTRDYVELREDPRLNFAGGTPFTLAGWASTEADRGVICAFRKSKGFGVISVSVVKGNLHGWVRDDNSGFGGVQLPGGPIKDGKWHHFALARHADGSVELFLDARSQGKNSGKNSGGPITTDLRALGSDRFVATSGKEGAAYFAGSIDEICLFDRALTSAEIGALSGKKE